LCEEAALRIQCWYRGCLAKAKVLEMRSCPDLVDDIIDSMVGVAEKADELGPPQRWTDKEKAQYDTCWNQLFDLCRRYGECAGFRTTEQDTAKEINALLVYLLDMPRDELKVMLQRSLKSRMDADW